MKKIELLAPAGSELAFRAAIENGADAIYLGTEEFSARSYAENFKIESLPEMVKEAHKRGVKVYLTVNTLLNDQEIKAYPEYLYKVAQAGVDALIVQDWGVVNLTKTLLPEMPLHGSTQMTVNNSAGAKYLEKHGFERVVLARETSLEEVKKIKKATNLEIEIFAHGALCVSYSGICYLSSMLGGRSGNRGKCAQPCRLEYEFLQEKEKTLLSTKDIRMIEYIPEIVKTGLKSIKIEGRMKKPEYVAVVIDNYRKAIDSYYENPNEFSIDPELIRELDQSFSRGSSTGHYLGKISRDGMSWEKQIDEGIVGGKVVSFRAGNAHVKLSEDLNLGDHYSIDSYNGPQAGEIKFSAKKGETVEVPIKGRVRIGELLYKVRDGLLQKKARDTFTSPRVTSKKNIDITVSVEEGKNLAYKVTDEDGTSVEGEGKILGVKAIKRPLTEETILEQFSRLGNTPFEIRSIQSNISGQVMVPLSELNNIRKEFVKALEDKYLENFNVIKLPPYEDFISSLPYLSERTEKKLKKVSVAVSSVEAVESALEGGADIIYLYLESLRMFKKVNIKDVSEALEICKGKCQLSFIIPGIIKEAHKGYYEDLIKEISKLGGLSFSAANLSALPILQEASLDISEKKAETTGEYTLNVFNSYALKFFENEGLKRVTLSPELSLDQLNEIYNSEAEKEVIIQGNFPLMTTEYCLLESSGYCMKKNKSPENSCSENLYLKDRKNFNMPLAFDYNCKMYVFNVKEISLYRDMEKIAKSKIDIFRIEGRMDSPDNIYIKTKMYKEQVEKYNNRGNVKITKENIEKIAALSPDGLTAGHLFRGVE